MRVRPEQIEALRAAQGALAGAVEAKDRHIATPEGARYYGAPIGTPLPLAEMPLPGMPTPMSPEEMRVDDSEREWVALDTKEALREYIDSRSEGIDPSWERDANWREKYIDHIYGRDTYQRMLDGNDFYASGNVLIRVQHLDYHIENREYVPGERDKWMKQRLPLVFQTINELRDRQPVKSHISISFSDGLMVGLGNGSDTPVLGVTMHGDTNEFEIGTLPEEVVVARYSQDRRSTITFKSGVLLGTAGRDVEKGWWSVDDMDDDQRTRYLLAHEWGHLVPPVNTREHHQNAAKLGWTDRYLSKYSKTNYKEETAEAFALWFMNPSVGNDPDRWRLDDANMMVAATIARDGNFGAEVKVSPVSTLEFEDLLSGKHGDDNLWRYPDIAFDVLSTGAAPTAAETKIDRHVRDSAYWGAPVGTPLPLAGRGGVVSEASVPPSVVQSVGTMNVILRTEARDRGLDPDESQFPQRMKASIAQRLNERLQDVPTDELVATVRDSADYEHNDKIKFFLRGVEDALAPESEHPHDLVALSGDGEIIVDDETWFQPGHSVVSIYDRTEPYTDLLGRNPVRTGSPEAEMYVREECIRHLVSSWAATSNDNHVMSLGVQEAARAEFGIEDAVEWTEALPEIKSRASTYFKEHGSTLRSFVRAQYDETQEMFARYGVTGFTAYRGYIIGRITDEGQALAGKDEPSRVRASLRPLSSWSTDIYVAQRFAGVSGERPLGVVLKSVIPSSHVLSVAATGSGCWGEREVVVIGVPLVTDAIDVSHSYLWSDDRYADPEFIPATKTAEAIDIDCDDTLENADWIKTLSWDLPDTVDGMERMFGTDWRAKFSTLPCWKAAPDALTDESKGVRRVRDPKYWGKPYGTIIEPGMKPVGDVVSAATEPVVETFNSWRDSIDGSEKRPSVDEHLVVTRAGRGKWDWTVTLGVRAYGSEGTVSGRSTTLSRAKDDATDAYIELAQEHIAARNPDASVPENLEPPQSEPLPANMEKSIIEHRRGLDYLFHTYDLVSSGRGKGKRRPLVPGGSRWGHGGVYLSQEPWPSDGHTTDMFEGPFTIYQVQDNENGAGTIWDGFGVDKAWNKLADAIARRAGYEDNYNVMHLHPAGSPGQYETRPWDDRQRFYAEVRKTLEARGFDGIQCGGEIVVWNYDKLVPSRDKELLSMFGVRGGVASAIKTAPEKQPVPPKPEHPSFDGLEGEAFDAAFDKMRADDREWNTKIKTGLSLGIYTYEDASAAGWLGSGNDSEWHPLPTGSLYHVTTAKSAVLAEGLKTRDEIGSDARGLGGGESDTISLTEDPSVAAAILDSLHGMRSAVRGDITLDEMVMDAREGRNADRPFYDDFMQSLTSTIGEKRIIGMLDGNEDPDEKERSWLRYSAYKTFLFWREQAGGPMDPLFFGSDPASFLTMDPEEFAVIEVRAKPGAMGYQMGSLGEWRTGTGQALEIVTGRGGVVSAADEPPEDYRRAHTAPSPDFGAPASDMTAIYPNDFYDRPEIYSQPKNKADAETLAVLNRVRGNPNAMVTIYRAAPAGATINPGDWVSLSETYAREHGMAEDPKDDMPVIKKIVRASEVWTNGDSVNEFGWHPKPEPPDTVALGREWPTEEPHPFTGERLPKADVTLLDGRTVHIESGGDAVPGGYNGWFAMFDHATGKKVGYIDYQSATDESFPVLISMIEVDVKFRGNEYAEALVARLHAEFPNRRITAGLTTDEGTKWWPRIAEKMGWSGPDFNEPVFASVIDRADEIAKLDKSRLPLDADLTSHGDFMLAEIQRARGFDALPEIVDAETFSKLVGQGYTFVYRGIGNPTKSSIWNPSGRTAADYAEDFRRGTFYAGTGAVGNGAYATSNPRIAAGYGGLNSEDPGVVIPMALKPGSQTINVTDLINLQEKYAHSIGYAGTSEWIGYAGPKNKDARVFLAGDPGRFAAMMGYDAIIDDYPGTPTNYILLNRGALVVRDTNWTDEEA